MNRWKPFEWITALRFLKEGQMQTIFIITAVAIGVAVIVFMSAMLASLQANFLKRVLTSQPHDHGRRVSRGNADRWPRYQGYIFYLERQTVMTRE